MIYQSQIIHKRKSLLNISFKTILAMELLTTQIYQLFEFEDQTLNQNEKLTSKILFHFHCK
jgi:hypothetical protein